MGILMGTSNVRDIFIGASPIKQVWLGTDLVFSKGTYIWTMYDNGLISGIDWGRNKFPRTGGTGNISSRYEDTTMHAYCNATGEPTAKSNCHFNTVNTIAIPPNATKLCVSARYLNASTDIRFGMLPANTVNSQSTVNGGFLSGTLTLTSSYATYSVDIPSSVLGATDLYVVVNAIIKLDKRRDTYVRKVWFE